MDSAVKQFLVPALIVAGCIAVLMIARAIAFRVFLKWSARTETDLDDLVLASLKTPSLLVVTAVGLHAGLQFSGVAQNHLQYLSRILYIIIILSFTIVTANLSGHLFKSYIRKTNIPIPTTGLAYVILKGTIIAIGVLIALSVLEISIAPLLTALGVGGLAVALALQDTLSNLFSGIHLMMEKSVRVGDFIRLESGQEGYVDDITWRTTRVRMLPNNMVVIPNNKLAQSIVTNYYLPEKRMSLPVLVSVSYSSDPDHVERVLMEEAKKATQEIPELLSDFEPAVRFIPGFGESSLDFTVVCQIGEFIDQYPAQHELRKRIFKRFREEGIEIPYPHRTVYVREEPEWKKQTMSSSSSRQ